MTQHANFTATIDGLEVVFNLENDSTHSLVNDIQTITQRAAGAAANAATKQANENARASGPTQTEPSATGTSSGASSTTSQPQTSAPEQAQPTVHQGVQGVFVSPQQVAEYRQNGHVAVGSPETVPQGFTAVPGPTGGLLATPQDAGQFTAWIDKNFPVQPQQSQTQQGQYDTQSAPTAEATTQADAQQNAAPSATATGTLSAEDFMAHARAAVSNLTQKYGGEQGGHAAAVQVLQQFGHQGFTTVTADQYAAVLNALQQA